MSVSEARILVVDDEKHVLMTVQAILQEEGYLVDVASDGTQAMAALNSTHYDLVLTDLKMPGVDGLGVLAEVRKCSPSTITLMMTGYGSVGSAIEAVHLGAYEYLLKPMEVPELKQAVRRSLERKRLSEIESLYRVMSAVTRSFRKETIAQEIEKAARDVLSLTFAQLISIDREGRLETHPELASILKQENLIQVLETGACITDDCCPEALAKWAETRGILSFAVVPGLGNRRLCCILLVHNGSEKYEFRASALRYLQALAGQSALALANASLFAQLQQNNLELESANRRLRELDRLRSQFLGIATHELRTPLTIIMGYNAMVAESLQDRATAEEKELLRESVAACQGLVRMVNSMLDITQVEAGKLRMDFSEADLKALVSSVVGFFQPEAAQRNIHLGIEVPPHMPLLFLDPDRMEQVVINLIGNALKYTNSGGRVDVFVRYFADSETAEVAVRDTGVGIAPEDQELIFDEFTRVARTKDTVRKEGNGLGLSIAKRIVEAHLGSIRVESIPGKGSVFTVTLPVRRSMPHSTIAVSA